MKVGRLLDTNIEDDKFTNFKAEMENKFLEKYVEINRKQSKNSLAVVYKSFFYNLWQKILNFFQSKKIKN